MNTEPNNAYYPELWDDPGSAPAWRKERVWAHIQDRVDAPTRVHQPRRWRIWLLLVFLLTALHFPEPLNRDQLIPPPIHPIPEEQPLPESEPSQKVPAIVAPPVAVSREAPLPVTPLPRRLSLLPTRPLSIEQQDDAWVQQLPHRLPKLLAEPMVRLYPQGTKVTLKVPELLDVAPSSESYWVRVFRQIQNINTNGKIDWKDLNIIPDENGGFVIFHYPSTLPTPQNN